MKRGPGRPRKVEPTITPEQRAAVLQRVADWLDVDAALADLRIDEATAYADTELMAEVHRIIKTSRAKLRAQLIERALKANSLNISERVIQALGEMIAALGTTLAKSQAQSADGCNIDWSKYSDAELHLLHSAFELACVGDVDRLLRVLKEHAQALAAPMAREQAARIIQYQLGGDAKVTVADEPEPEPIDQLRELDPERPVEPDHAVAVVPLRRPINAPVVRGR
jgi:hypothetical protein